MKDYTYKIDNQSPREKKRFVRVRSADSAVLGVAAIIIAKKEEA
jgi:hypothetical protein